MTAVSLDFGNVDRFANGLLVMVHDSTVQYAIYEEAEEGSVPSPVFSALLCSKETAYN